MEYQIVRLIDKPEMKEQMAKWFHEKWTVPLQAYLDLIGKNDCSVGELTELKLEINKGYVETLEILFENRIDLECHVLDVLDLLTGCKSESNRMV